MRHVEWHPSSEMLQLISSDDSKKIQLFDYIANKVILDKLIEFRDHFNIIRIYFEERELEKSRIIGIFEPLLLQIAELSKTPILSFDSILAFDEISKIKSKIK